MQLPPEALKYAAQAAKQTNKPRIFIAIPNMLTDRSGQRVWWEENSGLTQRLFQWAADDRYSLQLLWPTELRFHDHSRNAVIPIFMQSGMEWLLYLDSDTVPHPKLLELCRRGKQIVSGTVFCFVKQQLMPSIWRRAECEQCQNVADFKAGKPPRDAEQYKVRDGKLLRWNPFSNDYEEFEECRCKGTGLDPWVFKCHPGAFDPSHPFFQCDSVGGAALMIHRSVFEKLPKYPFQFLFRPKREILLTEDHYFAWKAAEAGYEIWADNQLPSSHYKTMDLLAVNQLMVKAMEYGRKMERDEAQKPRIIIPSIIPGVVKAL